MQFASRIALALAALAALAACKQRPAPPAGAEGPTLVVEAGTPAAPGDGALAADPNGPRERQCFVALKRSWGTALRSVRTVGTREEVIRQAQLKACAEIGVVEETCTDDLFNMDLAGCVGDPREPRAASGNSAEAAAAIQQAIQAQQGGADLRDPDAGPPHAPEPADAAPASNVPEMDGQPIPL